MISSPYHFHSMGVCFLFFIFGTSIVIRFELLISYILSKSLTTKPIIVAWCLFLITCCLCCVTLYISPNMHYMKNVAWHNLPILRLSFQMHVLFFLIVQEADKIALANSTGLDQKQINNWFINQRKRHWKPSENMQFNFYDG